MNIKIKPREKALKVLKVFQAFKETGHQEIGH